ncbi:carbonic anhydrase 4-like [Ascaphus truei]|uniref:carbonic anhydrase 4-like n=1 Tax=Ascaphus truei TaxID=8439 RepID=UPI003F5A00F9
MRRLHQMLLIMIGVSLKQATADWCYTEELCGPSSWGALGSCSGSRQSPIDIPEISVQPNISLGSFTFSSYNNASKLLALTHTGHTVEVSLGDGVTLSGGSLSNIYKAVAFHFHWGNRTSPGSEHRLSGKQYPMEMHIVHTKGDLTVADAKKDPAGLAVLGFFIDVSVTASTSHLTALSDLLGHVSAPGSKLLLNSSVSLDALLGDVDRSQFFRYLGSLTTPTCDEAVVWTVFKNPIKVPASVIEAFSSRLSHNVSGEFEPLLNVFRPLQLPGTRGVQASFVPVPLLDANSTSAPRGSPATTSAASHTAPCMALISALILLQQQGP